MLVSEYSERHQELTPLAASRDCLYRRDVHFFIFTSTGKNLGATEELGIAANDPEMAGRTGHCAVFDQLEDGHGSMSELTLEKVENAGIIKQNFTAEEDLRPALLRRAMKGLIMLRYDLMWRDPWAGRR